MENVEFVEQMNPRNVILVHGERSQAARLRSRLLDLGSRKSASSGQEAMKVFSPENGAVIRIPFRKDKYARVVGRLAQKKPSTENDAEGQIISGVLVQNGFKMSLMAPEDLKEYAKLTTTTIICKQHITLAAAGVDLIKWALEGTFGAIEEISPQKPPKEETAPESKYTNGDPETADDDEHADEELTSEPARSFLIMGCITLTWSGREKQVEIEWEGNTMNDGIADAVMAVLMTVESSPAAVKYSSKLNGHAHGHHHDAHVNGDSGKKTRNQHANVSSNERLARLKMFLEEQFGADGVTEIRTPRLAGTKASPKDEDGSADDEDSEEDSSEEQEQELARLASIGVPVPGLEIKVDKHVAKVWLEDLDVECANGILRERVRAVVERAVETVAPLWSGKGVPSR